MNKKQLLKELIRATQGKFFSVTFLTKGGEKYTMNGKNKYLRLLSQDANRKGKGTLGFTPYVAAVNRNLDAYRAINSDKLIRFECGGIVYENSNV